MRCRKKISIWGLLAIGFSLLTSCGLSGGQLPPNPEGVLTVFEMSETFTTGELPVDQLGRSDFNFVSLTEYDQYTVLAAEYADLVAINLKDPEKSRMVTPPEGIPVWNPTGVCYDQNGKLLYIANYTGHNILVCSVGEDWKLHLEKEIRLEGMQSPENVAMNPDRSRIAVADFDAERIFLLDQDGNLLWENELGRAHGVAIDDEAVYATSLLEACVVKYDYDGQVMEKRGSLNSIGQDAYMWPTELSLYGDSLLLADAHAGRIIQLDKNLRYQTSIGCNGPAVNQLNFPYCVYPMQGKLLITDTYNSRILMMDSTGFLTGQIIPGSMATDMQVSREPANYHQPFPYLYERLDAPSPTVLNPLLEESDSFLVNSYSSLWLYRGDQQQAKIMVYYPDWPSAAPIIEQLYMTWMHPMDLDGDCIQVISGPQRTAFMYFFDETNRLFFTTRMLNTQGIWKTQNDLHALYYPDPEAVVKERFSLGQESRDLFCQLISQGRGRREAYEEAFIPYYNKNFGTEFSPEQFTEWLDGVFTTEAGKAFLASDMGPQAAYEYFATLLETNWWYMPEIFFVRTFSGV